jgi:acyl transferase domain-containing protein
LPHADVAQTAICQVVSDACRHAGWNPFDLPHRRAGVYIGHTTGGRLSGELTYATCAAEAAQYLRELEVFRQSAGQRAGEILNEIVQRLRDTRPRRTDLGHPMLLSSVGAGIVADAFGLDGPAMVVDSACSSSLQALALAARDLWAGQIDMAVVGGASYLGFEALVLFSNAQSVTAGESCPFDAAADGFVAALAGRLLVERWTARRPARSYLGSDPRIGVASDGRGKACGLR